MDNSESIESVFSPNIYYTSGWSTGKVGVNIGELFFFGFLFVLSLNCFVRISSYSQKEKSAQNSLVCCFT
jgi:hypothetical protein